LVVLQHCNLSSTVVLGVTSWTRSQSGPSYLQIEGRMIQEFIFRVAQCQLRGTIVRFRVIGYRMPSIGVTRYDQFSYGHRGYHDSHWTSSVFYWGGANSPINLTLVWIRCCITHWLTGRVWWITLWLYVQRLRLRWVLIHHVRIGLVVIAVGEA
jgi:hypothetical protein